MDKRQILVVDDEDEIREVIRILLESEGFEIREARDGDEALQMVSPQTDLIILDVMMPGINGYKTCQLLREKTIAPILFLTAKTRESDLTMGFSSGGDDYLSKPFSYTELVARVKGLLRRYYVYKGKDTLERSSYIQIGELAINREVNEVQKNGKEILLTDLEYRILRLMAANRRKLFSARYLYESVWDEPYLSTSNNTITVHIRKIREKIEDDPQHPKYIKTIWGKGYRIE
ncbi:response regulator transcription factor [Diplocloster modestus]|uniref:Stage 0 sporulation protein A homolog n=1 Tax=Diplocloster modestus TaxID=2850322 RepID=A0ABS6K9G3_9FIRM|nr:response regulator transcription factor [Diplocloster modestus]MBU9727138.1 response regulator transcription factor [Diplocloster modestus]